MHKSEKIRQNGSNRPMLSVVVIFHDMIREADRTLFSLSADYQSDVTADDYEVIAIDNGSANPLDARTVTNFGTNYNYHYFEIDSVSPAKAINFGSQVADGEFIAVVVDGARMVTPGIVNATLKAVSVFPDPFVCALSWHLGPDIQRLSMVEGYNRSEEDKLLSSIRWETNGYRLFEISTIAPSSNVGFLGGMPTECSWFAMSCAEFLEMGGYDERFQSPGGGLVNHDFLNRILLRIDLCPIVILGEGCFHQMHGGVATNSKPGEHPFPNFQKEYQSIHGKPYKQATGSAPFYLGAMPSEAVRFVRRNAKEREKP